MVALSGRKRRHVHKAKSALVVSVHNSVNRSVVLVICDVLDATRYLIVCVHRTDVCSGGRQKPVVMDTSVMGISVCLPVRMCVCLEISNVHKAA